MKDNIVLEMKNIHKSFPGVRALQAVDFTLCEGEIHALMGENGAGKSTLIKVLTGVYEKDEGQIFIKGKEGAVAIRSPQEAQKNGISTVYQSDDSQTDGDNRSSRQDTVIITDENRAQTGLIQHIVYPEYRGAIVVCQGADNLQVRLNIMEAVARITGLGMDKISVLKMK